MHDEDPVASATNVQFDTVDTEVHRSSKGRDGVLALENVQSTVGEDVNHSTSFAGAKSNYMDVTPFIRESALVFGPKIR
jgi:hypothetical protein